MERRTPSSHTMEAYGHKGMQNKQWRKTFKSSDHAHAWAEKNDASVLGTRDLESAKRGSLSPAVGHLNKETERGEHSPAVGGYSDHKHGGES